MTPVILFIFGLIVGSFVNVVIVRMQNGTSPMEGRSACPECGETIAWYDNIPLLSFALLRGRCRHCSKKISWQYPLVELSAAIVFVIFGAIAIDFDILGQKWIGLILLLFVISCFIVLFVYDLVHMELPVSVLWCAIGGAAAFSVANVLLGATGGGAFAQSLVASVLSGAGAFAFFFALSAYSREQWMGAGDAYVAAAIGILLGWPGTFLAMVTAFALGAIVGIGLMAAQKADGKTHVPFAPFLIAGFMLTVLGIHFFPHLFLFL